MSDSSPPLETPKQRSIEALDIGLCRVLPTHCVSYAALLFHASIQTKQCLCLLPIPQAFHWSPFLLLSVETQSCTAYLITSSSHFDCTSFSSLPPTKTRAAQPPSWQPPLEEYTFHFVELWAYGSGCSSRLSGNGQKQGASHTGIPVPLPSS